MQPIIQLADNNVEFLGLYSFPSHLMILVVLVVAATVVDIRAHRIPNWLVGTGVVIAVVYHVFSPFGQGATFTLAGLIVGMATLMPLYVLRTMGAGDVKLMGMIGAFVGTAAVVNVVLATMVAGGIFALVAAVYKHALPQLLGNLRTMLIQRDIRRMKGAGSEAMQARPSVGKLPYAVAIASGTAFQIFILRA